MIQENQLKFRVSSPSAKQLEKPAAKEEPHSHPSRRRLLALLGTVQSCPCRLRPRLRARRSLDEDRVLRLRPRRVLRRRRGLRWEKRARGLHLCPAERLEALHGDVTASLRQVREHVP